MRSNAAGRIGLATMLIFCASAGSVQGQFRLLEAVETTIATIHRAMEAGDLTCRELVEMYLSRIEAYDRQGPALNAIVTINPSALEVAGELDIRLAESGRVGPLHCVPVIVKDNYETRDLPTTAGSLSFEGFIPPDDAFQVRRLREAGAIVLAKSNMAEFAFSAYETLSSILPGHTRNPYALDRVPAGSSGGTAAAVAASFGAVGLGTDTGNSIRGPSSHTALVGIRLTMGLTSRDGIVPLNPRRDVGGPMARTVADAVAVLDVIAGYDPADPVTERSQGRIPATYTDLLVADGLEDSRIGVLRRLSDSETANAGVSRLFERAIVDMRARGAHIVDPVPFPDIDQILPRGRSGCSRFKFAINAYLAGLEPSGPARNLKEIIASRKFHPSIEKRLTDAEAADRPPSENPDCKDLEEKEERLREAVLRAMEDAGVDALVYPTWNNPPRLIGDLNTPHGNNSPRISPPTGFPAITVPMGFVDDRLPAGIQFLGRPWSEPTLIRIAYSYEQATLHRRPPPTVPPIEALR